MVEADAAGAEDVSACAGGVRGVVDGWVRGRGRGGDRGARRGRVFFAGVGAPAAAPEAAPAGWLAFVRRKSVQVEAWARGGDVELAAAAVAGDTVTLVLQQDCVPMGSPVGDGEADERPLHVVDLSAFDIDR